MEIEIFNKKFIEILKSNYDEQIKFLKIYPIFRNKKDMLILWQNIYIENINLPEKASIINFILIALENNLIKYSTTEIINLLNLMKEYNESETIIELVKTSIYKGRSYTGVKQLLSNENLELQHKVANSSIKNMNPKEIALELTRICGVIMHNVSYHDLLTASIDDNINDENLNTITLLTKYFKKLSYVVLFTILIEDKTDIDRIKTVRHILKICDEIKHLHNYHALFPFIVGLNNSVIQRLDNIWKLKYDNFEEYSSIINPCNNYKNYRSLLKKNIKNNILPYIGIIISDIKHTLEQPLYDSDDFNMYLYNAVINLLDNFKNLHFDYKIEKNNQIMEWFLNINITYTEEQFYNISTSLKSTIHKPLIDQLANNHSVSISEDEPLTPKSPHQISFSSHSFSDSVGEIINISHVNKRKKHLSDRPYTKKVASVENNTTTTNINYNILKTWSKDDVKKWLKSIELEMYCDLFYDEDIDGVALYHITNDYLKNDMNITKLGHRLKILALSKANIR